MPKKGEPRLDTCWRKSRIAARILLREEAGKLTPRDVALGRKFTADEEVLPRLIAQAIQKIRSEKINWSANSEKQLDALVIRLQRLEEKDLEAFKLVISKTGHPTEEEFTKHLQKAVDLYRPKFDEETTRGDMFVNTRKLWKILWNKEIDVRVAIIRPALARTVHN
ncbi:MAG TPA: hypothetical protein VGM58_07425 [Verrucomicrobiae bacterium]